MELPPVSPVHRAEAVRRADRPPDDRRRESGRQQRNGEGDNQESARDDDPHVESVLDVVEVCLSGEAPDVESNLSDAVDDDDRMEGASPPVLPVWDQQSESERHLDIEA